MLSVAKHFFEWTIGGQELFDLPEGEDMENSINIIFFPA